MNAKAGIFIQIFEEKKIIPKYFASYNTQSFRNFINYNNYKCKNQTFEKSLFY